MPKIFANFNEYWGILTEPFNHFMTRSADLTFATKHNTPERLQAICQWLIQLCDWSQTGFSNQMLLAIKPESVTFEDKVTEKFGMPNFPQA